MSYDNNFFEDFEDDDTNNPAGRDPFDFSYEEECVCCYRVAPLVDGECPDCRH
jgi:hypothetical protein